LGKLGRSTGSIYHTEETENEGGKNKNVKIMCEVYYILLVAHAQREDLGHQT